MIGPPGGKGRGFGGMPIGGFGSTTTIGGLPGSLIGPTPPGGSGCGLSVILSLMFLMRLSRTTVVVSFVAVSFLTGVGVTVLNCLTTTGVRTVESEREAENERIPPPPPPPPDLARASVALSVTEASAAIARLESMMVRVFMV